MAVSFAFPEEVLRPMVPAGLEIDGYEGMGFVTVAMVWTKRLRPAGFPSFLGQDFFLAGYRVFTRFNDGGRRLRGLYILRSETDRRRMVWAGNRLTRYAYRHVNIRIEEGNPMRVETRRPDGTATLRISFFAPNETTGLPASSPFPDWRTARRFAGPMPFTFSPEGEGQFVVIEGSRQNWVPQPAAVAEWNVSLFEEAPLRGVKPVLANAFVASGIDYLWKRGRLARAGGAE